MTAWFWIPLISALVGGATNWLAVFLTLHPAREKRLGPFRFQGFLPRKSHRIAYAFGQRVLGDIVDLRTILAPVDVDEVARQVEAAIGERGDELLAETLSAVNPEFWAKLRPAVRAHWMQRMRPLLPRVIAQTFRQLQGDPEHYVDFPQLVADWLRDEPEILRDIVWQTGRREFRFIEWSGVAVGGLAGGLFAALWSLGPSPWLGGIGGGLIGGLTNWVAVNAVFEPKRPFRIGGWAIQGIVYRHQQETARQLAFMLLDRLMQLGTLIQHLASFDDAFYRLSRDAVREELERASNGASMMIGMALGAESVDALVDATARAITRHGPPVVAGISLPEETRASIAALLHDSLRELPADAYGDLMRSAVREDEPLLIASGVVVGAVVGTLGALLA